jgi:hypothetical protein
MRPTNQSKNRRLSVAGGMPDKTSPSFFKSEATPSEESEPFASLRNGAISVATPGAPVSSGERRSVVGAGVSVQGRSSDALTELMIRLHRRAVLQLDVELVGSDRIISALVGGSR